MLRLKRKVYDEIVRENDMRKNVVVLMLSIVSGCSDSSRNVDNAMDRSKATSNHESGPFWEESRREVFFSSGSGKPTAEFGVGTDVPSSTKKDRFESFVGSVRPGMTDDEVAAILGSPDQQKANDLGEFNPQKRGQRLEIWTWEATNGSGPSIKLSFVDGVLQDGGTPGYDIRMGFQQNP